MEGIPEEKHNRLGTLPPSLYSCNNAARRNAGIYTNVLSSRQILRRVKAADRQNPAGGSQCLASLSAMDIKSLRFVLDMVSKDLISLFTGLPRFTWSGTLGAAGFPSPWKRSWYGSTSNAFANFSKVASEGAVYPPSTREMYERKRPDRRSISPCERPLTSRNCRNLFPTSIAQLEQVLNPVSTLITYFLSS